MFKRGAFLALTLIGGLFINTAVIQQTHAANEISRLVPFQGRLHGTDNKAVADGVYDINFNIYDTPTGGTPAWTESHGQVSVIHGYVNVLLGAISPMHDVNYANVTGTPAYDASKNNVDFTTKKYLGISINGGVEMFPRSQLVPSFHAYTANHADHATRADNADNADNLGGLTPEQYVTEAELSNSGLAKNIDNLSLLADKAAARSNLDINSKSEASALFLNETSNLSDLTDVTAARGTLDVYSKSEVSAQVLDESSNLSDLTDIGAARTTLSVNSKAEDTALFLDESSNLSDLPNKTTARSNLGVYSTTDTSNHMLNESSNLSDLHNITTARNNLGLDQALTTNVLGSYGRADIGNLRIFYGSQSVAGRGTVTKSISPCFSGTNSYSIISNNTYSGIVSQYASSVVRQSGCTFQINNNNTSSVYINWIAIGHAN